MPTYAARGAAAAKVKKTDRALAPSGGGEGSRSRRGAFFRHRMCSATSLRPSLPACSSSPVQVRTGRRRRLVRVYGLAVGERAARRADPDPRRRRHGSSRRAVGRGAASRCVLGGTRPLRLTADARGPAGRRAAASEREARPASTACHLDDDASRRAAAALARRLCGRTHGAVDGARVRVPRLPKRMAGSRVDEKKKRSPTGGPRARVMARSSARRGAVVVHPPLALHDAARGCARRGGLSGIMHTRGDADEYKFVCLATLRRRRRRRVLVGTAALLLILLVRMALRTPREE